MRYSEARGTLIYEKNLKSEISCQTPLKKNFDLYHLHKYFLTSAAMRRTFLRPLWIVTRSVRTVPTEAVTLVSYRNKDSSLGVFKRNSRDQ
jgi:hypothetical protein